MKTGTGLSVDADGSFEVTTLDPRLEILGERRLTARPSRPRYAAQIAPPITGRSRSRHDNCCSWCLGLGGSRMPITIARAAHFKLVYLTAGKTSELFPTISSYPRNLHHLTYTGTFGGFSFERFGPELLCSDRAERVEQERSPGAKGGVPQHRGPSQKNPQRASYGLAFVARSPFCSKSPASRSLATALWKGALARGLLRLVSGIARAPRSHSH